MNEELRRELAAMADEDQRIRRLATGLDRLPDDLAAEWELIDRRNTARFVEIVAEHGWPGRGLVGDDGANAAWLLAQHADRTPDLQRRFLDLLRAAVARNEASAVNLAYLTDRVAVNDGRPQVYGTQLRQNEGTELVPDPIADADTVDERRSAVGLGPLAEYVEVVRSHSHDRQGRDSET
jgi:hypothetical protein